MFRFAITTPVNTTKADPLVTELPLRPGVINLVHVAFPPGPVALAHVAVYRAGSLLWPTNDDDGFAWDNFTLTFNPLERLEVEPFSLQARTWNEDDTFEHLVVLRMNVLPLDIADQAGEELTILQRLSDRLLGRRSATRG